MFIGNCGADPEIRTFQDGGKIASTRIAVTERYTDRSGNQKESTEWIPVVFNGKNADIAEKYIRKGSSLYVSGKWHTREWTDRDGNKRTVTEIAVVQVQLLGPKPNGGTRQGGGNYGGYPDNEPGF